MAIGMNIKLGLHKNLITMYIYIYGNKLSHGATIDID